MTSTSKKNIHLYLEANPNPHSLKFVANFMLTKEGEIYDFSQKENLEKSPIAQELFQYPFVKNVFCMNNFITVNKEESYEWTEIQTILKECIYKYLESEQPIILEKNITSDATVHSTDTDIEIKIKNILDEYVKPAVEMDGGAIVFQNFTDGVLKLSLHGACKGCPSSTITLKSGIENLLKKMIPEVKEVTC